MTVQAGKLDHVLEIQRVTTTVSDVGQPVDDWATIATVRAERLRASFDERQKDWGDSSQATVTWCIRWIDDLRLGDRILLNGIPHDIKGIEPVGRRKELLVTTLYMK
ncbi:head-tail adaptor protein [Hyphomicrobium sp. MC1]|uniref:head-tail adaptor protein n=1 Tax=Hyphomicrobium sp. (strain MC1) TaxID=717785 RepID=UPI000213EB2B|nr:head-tail adaptor protein [Hyphomicrobium sp. MC1]CCB65398.1 putative Phage head-tail adaptor [Hyphomicrobium sp. MC1]